MACVLLPADIFHKIILRSLKKAAPLLLNVALLIGFFWLLFAIIGVQSFKSSLSRYCVWQDPAGIQANYTLNAYGAYQFCGGSLDADGSRMPYLLSDGVTSSNVTKGYLCPVNSVCVVSQSPYNGTVNFDNLFNALELIFVIMSSNTYTDLMYYLTDSDYLIVAICKQSQMLVANCESTNVSSLCGRHYCLYILARQSCKLTRTSALDMASCLIPASSLPSSLHPLLSFATKAMLAHLPHNLRKTSRN